MSHEKPEWVKKAADAVSELIHNEEKNVKGKTEADESKLKADLHARREKIADLIHHYHVNHK